MLISIRAAASRAADAWRRAIARGLPHTLGRLAGVVACVCAAAGCASSQAGMPASLAQGIVWQPDEDHINTHGEWDKLGVRDLLVQWTAVDGESLVRGAGLPTTERTPDWVRIAREPWARNVIVGLAGRFDETEARAQAAQLVEQSKRLVAARPPVHIDGWYFPVEVDPTWKDASSLAPLLEKLPRPLWISVYDNSNIGGAALAAWLDSWLPRDVGVFFQDGCGDYARSAPVARAYADELAARLGKPRVRIIAEAFRGLPGGGYRSADADELAPQLAQYRGYPTYLFDGPHYVSPSLVRALLARQADQK